MAGTDGINLPSAAFAVGAVNGTQQDESSSRMEIVVIAVTVTILLGMIVTIAP